MRGPSVSGVTAAVTRPARDGGKPRSSRRTGTVQQRFPMIAAKFHPRFLFASGISALALYCGPSLEPGDMIPMGIGQRRGK
jgi:hypothetical protein